MPLELLTVPCLQDNYAFLLVADNGEAALVDAPEAGPVNAVLAERSLTLKTVLLTHHHWDHTDGLEGLDTGPDLQVLGAAADAHRLPPLTSEVSEGDTVDILGARARIIGVSGHTVGHIAYVFEEEGLAFTGDSLMALGCGRLFEGTPEQMFESLSKLAALPDETMICSGHEYTASNGRFAASVDPENSELEKRNAETDELRAKGEFTVPSRLGLEKATNPFLRAHDKGIRAHLNMVNEPDVEVFSKLRALKDAF